MQRLPNGLVRIALRRPFRDGTVAVDLHPLSLLSEVSRPPLVSRRQVFGTGLSGTVFGGHDWAIGPQWSMGLALVASGITTAKMMDSDGDDTDYRRRAFSVGPGRLAAQFPGSLRHGRADWDASSMTASSWRRGHPAKQ